MSKKQSIYNGLQRKFNSLEQTSNSEQVRLNCPYCVKNGKTPDVNKKLYIHLGKKVFFCQRCASKGSLKTFILQNLGKEFEKLIEEDDDFLDNINNIGLSLTDTILNNLYPQKSNLKPKNVKLPKEYKKLHYSDNSLSSLIAFDYLFKRGLSYEDIIKYSLGYCSEGRYINRIIIPCFENNEIKYFTNRLYMWNNKPLTPEVEKYLNTYGVTKSLNMKKLDEETFRYISKSEVVFNIDNASKYKIGIIVEGPFDAISVGDSAMAILGSYLSKEQLRIILSKSFEKLYIMFDADAWEKSLKAAEMLNNTSEIYLVKLKDKDPGEMTKDEIVEALISSIKYNRKEIKLNESLRKLNGSI